MRIRSERCGSLRIQIGIVPCQRIVMGTMLMRKQLDKLEVMFKGAFAQLREQNPRYPTEIGTFLLRPCNRIRQHTVQA